MSVNITSDGRKNKGKRYLLAEEMSFCIRDMMKRPIFQRARLIAGKNGWYREVRWVHILEITNAAPYVSRNDLILTTGLWLKRSVKSGLDFMRQIIDHETAGLCIEFGTTVDEIPEEIIRLCNDHDFPLILFRQPVRFEAITQDIHSFLINRHFGLMKKLEEFSQKQQQLILQSTDIPAILELLQRYAEGQIIYLSAIKSNKFYPELPREEVEKINRFCHDKLKNFDQIEEITVWKMDDTDFLLIQPVICFGQVFSYIGMILHRPHPTEYIKLLLDYTSKAVATILLRTQFLEEKILRNQNALIQDILSQQIDSEEQAQMRMGLPSPDENRYLFIGGIIELAHNVLEVGPERMETMNQDISVLIRTLLSRFQVHYLMMMKNNQIYLLCAKEAMNADSEQRLRESILQLITAIRKFTSQALNGLNFHVGFGRTRSQLLETWKSFKEAYQVIEIAQAVPAMRDCCFYDKTGIYQLLQAVPQPLLQSFVHDQIGRLIDHDRTHHLNLIRTLTEYFRCMGSKGETAKRLYIHRQTLYNRLEKISDILGENFFEPQRRYCIEMALLGFELLGQK
jgi:Sugar diacid utilization regulator